MRSTLQKKQLEIPPKVLPLEPIFGTNPEQQMQWLAFGRKDDLLVPGFSEIISILHDFPSPPLQAIREEKTFEIFWPPGGPWGEDLRDQN
jgi:hypothetical protein